MTEWETPAWDDDEPGEGEPLELDGDPELEDEDDWAEDED
jgi:hypothetical protein